MKDTLIHLSKGVHKGPAADLVPVLFGERPPTVTKKDIAFSLFNSSLDRSQVMSCIFLKFTLTLKILVVNDFYSNNNKLIRGFKNKCSYIEVVTVHYYTVGSKSSIKRLSSSVPM